MISVGISNRHIHLSEKDKNILFGKDFELKPKRYLKQKGEFASESVLSVKTDYAVIENVRVIGPCRNKTQVELLKSDEKILNIDLPLRNSENLYKSASIILIGPKKEIYSKNSTIVANRHIHMNSKEALKYDVKDGEEVQIKKESIIIDKVSIRVNDLFKLECHLDKDDEKFYNIHTNDIVEIIKEEKC